MDCIYVAAHIVECCRYVSMQGELFLAPEAGHKHVYRNTDHVVVIAKE